MLFPGGRFALWSLGTSLGLPVSGDSPFTAPSRFPRQPLPVSGQPLHSPFPCPATAPPPHELICF